MMVNNDFVALNINSVKRYSIHFVTKKIFEIAKLLCNKSNNKKLTYL